MAQASVLQDVLDSIFEGGLRPGVVTVMRCSFISLILTLSCLLLATSFNVHVIALLLLSGGLFASTEWFVHELSRAETPAKREVKSE